MLSRIRREGVGKPGELVGRQRVGDDEDAMVRALVAPKPDGELDEIIAIPGDETAALVGGPLELLLV